MALPGRFLRRACGLDGHGMRASPGHSLGVCLRDGVEAVFGVGGERAAERLELRDDGVGGLVGLVLEDRDLAVPAELEVAVVRSGVVEPSGAY